MAAIETSLMAGVAIGISIGARLVRRACGRIIAGVFLGSLIWWFALTIGVSCFRISVTPRLMNISNKAAGLLLAMMAITTIVRGQWRIVICPHPHHRTN